MHKHFFCVVILMTVFIWSDATSESKLHLSIADVQQDLKSSSTIDDNLRQESIQDIFTRFVESLQSFLSSLMQAFTDRYGSDTAMKPDRPSASLLRETVTGGSENLRAHLERRGENPVSQPPPPGKDAKDNKEAKDPKEAKDTKEAKDPKDTSKDPKDANKSKIPKGALKPREDDGGAAPGDFI